MKPIIFAAFSDHRRDLAHILPEHRELQSFFQSNERHKKVRFLDNKDYSADWILDELDNHGKEIRLFYYIGHSDNNVLHFLKGGGKKEALAAKLNSLARNNKLQCVVLNGCSNYDIVNELKDVPVVIGTKSSIEDLTASKFGISFFKNLIDNQYSYSAAFDSAISNAYQSGTEEIQGTSITRSGFIPGQHEDLNQWVCVEKEEGLASRLNFEFGHKLSKRFIPYAIGIFLIGALFFLYDDILFQINKYKIPPFNTDKKCKILIQEFTAYSTEVDVASVNDDIARGILLNSQSLKDVEAIAVNKISDYIKNPEDTHKLPKLAGYNYNLYGRIDELDKGYELNFSVEPLEGFEGLNKQSYVKTLGSIYNLIQELDTTNIELKFLIHICSICGNEDSKIFRIAETLTDSLFITDPEDAQKSYAFLASIAKKNERIKESVSLFDKASNRSAPDTDVALAALQASSNIRIKSLKYDDALHDQIEIVERTQLRMAQSNNIAMNHPSSYYKQIGNEFRQKRANNVLNNLQELRTSSRSKKMLVAMAINDYKYLDSIKYQNLTYKNNINSLIDKSGYNPSDSDGDGYTTARGDCNDSNSKINPGVKEICDNKVDDDCDGLIDEGCRITYIISGKILDCNGRPMTKIREVNINNKRVKVNNAQFSTQIKSKPNKVIYIAPDSPYKLLNNSKNKIKLSNSNKIIHNIEIDDHPATGRKVRVHGRLMGTGTTYYPIKNGWIFEANSRQKTKPNGEGLFEFELISFDPCKSFLVFTSDGFKAQKVILKDMMFKNGVFDLGKIDMKK